MEHANQRTASLLNKPDFDIDSTAEPLNKIEHQQYRSVIGDLWYHADSTRGDIAIATSKLATFNQKPTKKHKEQLYHVLS